MRTCLMIASVVLAVCGCGPQSSFSGGNEAMYAVQADPATAVTPDDSASMQPPNEAAPARTAKQRIIYTGNISIVVKDFAKTKTEIDSLLKAVDGHVSNFQEDRTYGDRRHGHWVVRVPVSEFHDFVDKIAKLGVAEKQSIDGQDVTEEFVDLEARLKNQRVLEERMLKLLEDRSGEIKEIIAVEEQLARVRGEIERMEGRLRYLTDRTELTTVTIDVREDRDYVPPAPPTLAARVAGAWGDSLGGMKVFGENLLIVVVAAVPWLLLIGLFVVPAALIVRRKLRKSAGA